MNCQKKKDSIQSNNIHCFGPVSGPITAQISNIVCSENNSFFFYLTNCITITWYSHSHSHDKQIASQFFWYRFLHFWYGNQTERLRTHTRFNKHKSPTCPKLYTTQRKQHLARRTCHGYTLCWKLRTGKSECDTKWCSQGWQWIRYYSTRFHTHSLKKMLVFVFAWIITLISISLPVWCLSISVTHTLTMKIKIGNVKELVGEGCVNEEERWHEGDSSSLVKDARQ